MEKRVNVTSEVREKSIKKIKYKSMRGYLSKYLQIFRAYIPVNAKTYICKSQSKN